MNCLPPQSFTLGHKDIEISMLYNNIGRDDNYINAWGFSIWIEDTNTAVLFDVGGDPSILWNNVRKSGVDINKLSKIVISHNHWDHVTSLAMILERTHFKPDIFVPDFDLENLKDIHPNASFVGIKEPAQIGEYLWSTGQLKGMFKGEEIHEQSLIIAQDNSVFLLTGCSHPGIVEIVKRAKKLHPGKKIKIIAGGFHLVQHSTEEIKAISSSLKSLQIETLAPSHCTGELAKNIFKEEWRDKFIDFENGDSIKIE